VAASRLTAAVQMLALRPSDRVLEVGCGPGVAAAMVAEQLDTGHLVAIDRSATAIARAEGRSPGGTTFLRTDLAGLRGYDAAFDQAFAVNVNVFWTSPADPECTTLLRVLRPGGRLLLVYEGPGAARDVTPTVTANLARHGFTAEAVPHPAVLAISAVRPPA
jgi:ubiquinone/menaquinone biosynthesis C-methylase UbiE